MTLIPPLNEAHTQRYVEGYTAVEILKDLGNGYTLHRGQYSKRHAHHDKKHGLLIVVTHEDVVVGVGRDEFYWVHPDHRQQGLAAEIHLAFIVRSDPVVIEHSGHRIAVTRKFATQTGRRMTMQGVLMARHTYKVLVERGVL